MSAAARETILARVRANLSAAGAAPLAAPGPPAARACAALAEAELPERFRARLEAVGGRVQRVAGLVAARAAVAEILRASDARRLLLSDAPLVQHLAAGLPAVLQRCSPGAPRPELFAADVGLTTAQWGIAETGTLVLESARESHRQASLVPPIHVALLPARALLATLGEALAALRGSASAPASRTITFVTGPSRTADIELTLVVGVHGPRELHVLVLDDDSLP